MTKTLVLLMGVGATVCVAPAQHVISAHSGTVHYTEGRVLMAGQAIESKFGQFPEMKENADIRTERGRAEVLLTPGVFLRLGEMSAARMLDNRLSNTRLEFLAGRALVECNEIPKDNSVTLMYRDSAISLRKRGLYRLDSEPARLRVYEGEAVVETAGGRVTVKGGRQLLFGGVLVAEKFNTKDTDSLYRWARRRAETLALANISASRSLRDSRLAWTASGWRWNPYFGMFTYIPYRGSILSPFGFAYWSPREVYRLYQQPVRMSGGGWDASMGGGRGLSGIGYSGGSRSASVPAASSPSYTSSAPANAAAPSAPASSRGGDGPRESGGRAR